MHHAGSYLRLDENINLLLHVLDLGCDGEPDDGPLRCRPDLLSVKAVQRVQAAFLVPPKLERLWSKFKDFEIGPMSNL
jgi:hypothetical protein